MPTACILVPGCICQKEINLLSVTCPTTSREEPEAGWCPQQAEAPLGAGGLSGGGGCGGVEVWGCGGVGGCEWGGRRGGGGGNFETRQIPHCSMCSFVSLDT